MKKIVVLTGAGISAESGLATFRDGNGLWENHRVEDVATPEAWHKDRELVLRFYNQRRRDVIAAQPNEAHKGLAALEAKYNVVVVTQNIDDLHERAGSTKVIHLHGEILKMRSERNKTVNFDIRDDIKVGQLAPDGFQLRPDIVWFGEEVPAIEDAMIEMESADIFILVGSSMVVYPAAGLMQYVPAVAPKYVLDKVIPRLSYPNIIPVEGSATQGIGRILDELLNS